MLKVDSSPYLRGTTYGCFAHYFESKNRSVAMLHPNERCKLDWADLACIKVSCAHICQRICDGCVRAISD